MKSENKVKFALIGMALAAMPFFAFAVTPTPGEMKQMRREMQENRQVFMEEMKTRRVEFNNKEKERLDALKKHFGEGPQRDDQTAIFRFF